MKQIVIKRWDSSPELLGALEFAGYLRSKGIVAAISHTEAEYDGIKAAYEAGYTMRLILQCNAGFL